jgi:hypothetical protein
MSIAYGYNIFFPQTTDCTQTQDPARPGHIDHRSGGSSDWFCNFIAGTYGHSHRAGQRGLDGISEHDAFFDSLIAAGVEIYRYEPGLMHGKFFLFDDRG